MSTVSEHELTAWAQVYIGKLTAYGLATIIRIAKDDTVQRITEYPGSRNRATYGG